MERRKKKKVRISKKGWLGKIWQKLILKTSRGVTKIGTINLREKNF